MTEPSHVSPTWVADLLPALDAADDAAAVAEAGVRHLRALTGACWAEVVHATPAGGLNTAATADRQLTAELQHLRSVTNEPPLPGTLGIPPVVVVDDLSISSPWPAFAAAATASTPVRSAMFVYAAVDDVPTVVTLYDDRPAFFDRDRQRESALMIRLLLLHLTRRRIAVTLAQLQAAMATRGQIGIATGILASLYGLSPTAAFDLLRSVSSDRNIKIRDLAELVIARGDLPLS